MLLLLYAFKEMCPAGEESANNLPCKPCKVNNYKAEKGVHRCQRCPDGHDTTGNEGATKCTSRFSYKIM